MENDACATPDISPVATEFTCCYGVTSCYGAYLLLRNLLRLQSQWKQIESQFLRNLRDIRRSEFAFLLFCVFLGQSPRFTDSDLKMKLTYSVWPEDMPLSLKCNATGASPMTVRWYKNGAPLQDSVTIFQGVFIYCQYLYTGSSTYQGDFWVSTAGIIGLQLYE